MAWTGSKLKAVLLDFLERAGWSAGLNVQRKTPGEHGKHGGGQYSQDRRGHS